MQGALPQPGEIFQAKYRLDAVLGEGGFARVYRATDLTIDRQVAVKVIKPGEGPAARALVGRFQQETRAYARVRQPNIVTLFDYGRRDDGVMFMVFELVGGEDLSRMLIRGALAQADTLRIVGQVLEALSEVHQVGLIHRDVKPENIRVYDYMGDRLRVKLLDFGIARPTDGTHAALTATGKAVGTPKYMAPEQLFGEPLHPSTDLYALALVTYTMLTARELDHVRLLANGQSVVIEPTPEISEPLRAVLNRMLERHPAARFQSAPEVLQAFAAVQSGALAPVVTPRPGPARLPAPAPVAAPSDAPPPRGRRDLVGVAAVGGFVISALTVAVGALLWQRAEPAPALPPRPAVRTTPAVGGLVRGTTPEPPQTPPPVTAPPAIPDEPPTAVPVGCGAPPPFQGKGWMTSADGFDQQRWLVYIPRGYDPDRRYPLVVLFHDDASHPEEVLANTGLAEIADTHGFVIAAPHDPGLMYVWTTRSAAANASRVAVETTRRLCIDETRQVLVGHASGSIGVESVSCADWVDGVVMTNHVGKFTRWFCNDLDPVPALYIVPTKTGFIPPDGGTDCAGGNKLSFDDVQAMWHERNACRTGGDVWFEHKDGVCRSAECSGAPFIWCEVEGGRRWPGSPPRSMDLLNCDGPDSKFPQSALIAKFLNELRAP